MGTLKFHGFEVWRLMPIGQGNLDINYGVGWISRTPLRQGYEGQEAAEPQSRRMQDVWNWLNLRVPWLNATRGALGDGSLPRVAFNPLPLRLCGFARERISNLFIVSKDIIHAGEEVADVVVAHFGVLDFVE
jgi:hypothetical protein